MATLRCGVVNGERVLRLKWLEPISKSPEEDNEASELDKSEEVLGVVFPADEDAALPLNPSEEAFDEPAPHVAAEAAAKRVGGFGRTLK